MDYQTAIESFKVGITHRVADSGISIIMKYYCPFGCYGLEVDSDVTLGELHERAGDHLALLHFLTPS
jgi:hypothetical protein